MKIPTDPHPLEIKIINEDPNGVAYVYYQDLPAELSVGDEILSSLTQEQLAPNDAMTVGMPYKIGGMNILTKQILYFVKKSWNMLHIYLQPQDAEQLRLKGPNAHFRDIDLRKNKIQVTIEAGGSLKVDQ